MAEIPEAAQRARQMYADGVDTRTIKAETGLSSWGLYNWIDGRASRSDSGQQWLRIDNGRAIEREAHDVIAGHREDTGGLTHRSRPASDVDRHRSAPATPASRLSRPPYRSAGHS